MKNLFIKTNKIDQIVSNLTEIKRLFKELQTINTNKITNTNHTIIIDIETTGLPNTKFSHQYYHPSMLNKYDKSRITEIGYIIMNNNDETIYEYCSLIKPNNFRIMPIYEKNTQKLLNDITHDKCVKNGIDIDIILQNMLHDIEKYNCDLFVSHNVKFDYNVILSECYRNKKYDLIKILENMKIKCTMEMGDEKYSIRKLDKLYKTIFKTEENEKHRALDDAKMCRDIYLYLKQL